VSSNEIDLRADLGPLRNVFNRHLSPLTGFTELLRLCNEHHTDYLKWARTTRAHRRQETDLAQILMRRIPNDPLLPTWEAVAGTLLAGFDLPAPVVFRSLAEAVHCVHRKAICEEYVPLLRKAGWRLRRGDLVYRPDSGLKSLFGGTSGLSPPPAKLRLFSSESPVEGYRIASSPLFDTFETYLDFDPRPYIDLLFPSEGGLLAVGVPNRDLEDFEWEYPPSDTWGVPVFFGVRPRREEDQAKRVERIVRAALDHQASIILLPELTSTPTIRDRTEAVLRDAAMTAKRPCLVIPGSYHDPETRVHEQLGWFVLPGERPDLLPMRHRKFNPLVSQLKGKSQPEYREVLDALPGGVPHPPVLRLYCGTEHRIATLICADALGQEVEEVLATLGVSILLIGAMSGTHAVFNQLAEGLTRATQALTLGAMVPWHNTGPTCMVRVPRRDDRPFWLGPQFETPKSGLGRGQPSPLGVPAVCLFNWRDPTADRWVPV
jgi:hypothetical protein